jgi:CCR4-NOT transcriptional regulation complex NOT5 subunit
LDALLDEKTMKIKKFTKECIAKVVCKIKEKRKKKQEQCQQSGSGSS